MAGEVLYDAFVEINGVDHSDHVTSVSLPMSTAALDAATMGDKTSVKVPGLLDYSLDIGFNDDFAAGGFDALIWALWSGRSTYSVKVRKSKTDARSATNPEYRFTGFTGTFGPGAEHGALVAGTLAVPCTDDLVRTV